MTVLKKAIIRLATLAFAGLLLALVLSSTAFAASGRLHPFIPGGISSTNKQAAFNTVMSRASVDTATATSFAHTGGSSTFKASAYKVLGYRNGAPGTANSGVSDSAAVVLTADTPECNVHSKMLAIMDTRTNQIILICVACGNIRIQLHGPAPKPHPFARNTVLKINRQYFRLINTTCAGTNQKVTVKVTSWVQTRIVAASWGQALHLISVRVNASFTQKLVNQTVKVVCSKLPPSATPQQICTVSLKGTWNGTTQTCVITTGDCSQTVVIMGNGNYVNQGSVTCTTNNSPPPSNFTATGSTSVQATKTVPGNCPAPNQSITKTGTGSYSLTSPTFIGTGTTQQAANDSLTQQEATWRTQNQSVADAKALAEAQNNLNSALQSCPVPSTPSVTVDIENINDIQAGSCRPVTVTVDSTVAGSVQIKPKYGMIGTVDCYTPSSEQSSVTEPVNVGHNTYTVYVWAPSDSSATTDTLTAAPTIPGVDASKNTASVTYTITHVQLS